MFPNFHRTIPPEGKQLAKSRRNLSVKVAVAQSIQESNEIVVTVCHCLSVPKVQNVVICKTVPPFTALESADADNRYLGTIIPF